MTVKQTKVHFQGNGSWRRELWNTVYVKPQLLANEDLQTVWIWEIYHRALHSPKKRLYEHCHTNKSGLDFWNITKFYHHRQNFIVWSKNKNKKLLLRQRYMQKKKRIEKRIKKKENKEAKETIIKKYQKTHSSNNIIDSYACYLWWKELTLNKCVICILQSKISTKGYFDVKSHREK